MESVDHGTRFSVARGLAQTGAAHSPAFVSHSGPEDAPQAPSSTRTGVEPAALSTTNAGEWARQLVPTGATRICGGLIRSRSVAGFGWPSRRNISTSAIRATAYQRHTAPSRRSHRPPSADVFVGPTSLCRWSVRRCTRPNCTAPIRARGPWRGGRVTNSAGRPVCPSSRSTVAQACKECTSRAPGRPRSLRRRPPPPGCWRGVDGRSPTPSPRRGDGRCRTREWGVWYG